MRSTIILLSKWQWNKSTQIQFLNHKVIKGPSAGMEESECKQTRKKKTNPWEKKVIFSAKHGLLLSTSIKTKVIKPHCLKIITAIVCQSKGPSHPSSFLQQWSFTDVNLHKVTPSCSCYKNIVPMNYNIVNKNCKSLELKKFHIRAWTSVRCSVCQPVFKKKKK